MTRMNWDYLAGFIDGEGSLCISYSRGRYTAHLDIGNTNKPVLDAIRDFLAQYDVKTGFTKIVPDGRTVDPKQAWAIHVSGKGIDYLLPILEPRLIVKQEQVRTLMKFRSLVGDKGRTLSETMRDKMAVLKEYCGLLNKYGSEVA